MTSSKSHKKSGTGEGGVRHRGRPPPPPRKKTDGNGGSFLIVLTVSFFLYPSTANNLFSLNLDEL